MDQYLWQYFEGGAKDIGSEKTLQLVKLHEKRINCMKWMKTFILVNILVMHIITAKHHNIAFISFYSTLFTLLCRLTAGFNVFQYENSFYLCTAGRMIVYIFLHLQAF